MSVNIQYYIEMFTLLYVTSDSVITSKSAYPPIVVYTREYLCWHLCMYMYECLIAKAHVTYLNLMLNLEIDTWDELKELSKDTTNLVLHLAIDTWDELKELSKESLDMSYLICPCTCNVVLLRTFVILTIFLGIISKLDLIHSAVHSVIKVGDPVISSSWPNFLMNFGNFDGTQVNNLTVIIY